MGTPHQYFYARAHQGISSPQSWETWRVSSFCLYYCIAGLILWISVLWYFYMYGESPTAVTSPLFVHTGSADLALRGGILSRDPRPEHHTIYSSLPHFAMSLAINSVYFPYARFHRPRP